MRRPSTNRPFVLVAVLATLLASRDALASPPSLDVGEGISECPSARELEDAIATQAGRDPFAKVGAPRVDVRVRKRDERIYAEVLVEAGGAPPRARVIDGDTCADVVRAAALVAALAIDEDAPKPEPPKEEPPKPPPYAREAPTPMVEDLRRARVAGAVYAATSLGLLPRPATGASAGVRVRVTDSVWLSARGMYLPPVSMPDDTFAMRLYGAGAGACAEPFGAKNVALLGCAHLMAGGLEVTAAQTPLRDAGKKAFVGASLAAGVRARAFGPVMIEGLADATLPFAHPTFLTATCPSSGFQQPFATLVLSLGAGVSIP